MKRTQIFEALADVQPLDESSVDNMSKQAWVGFGIYLGYKSAYRRGEMEDYGIDYNEVVAELTKVGLIRNGRIHKQARDIWKKNMPGTLASQVHQYAGKLGFKRLGY